jgi:hypothetical protein
MTEIEKTEGEIKVLQAKLELLKEMENFKTPAEIAYKDWWGEYPGTEIWTKDDEIRWVSFSAGYNASQELKKEQKWDVVRESVKWCEEHPDESVEDYLTPNLQKIIDKMVDERKSQKLWNMVRDELGYSIDLCDEIVDLVEKWIPEPQSAAGSQNVDVEFLVDGYNDCLTKIKGKLR